MGNIKSIQKAVADCNCFFNLHFGVPSIQTEWRGNPSLELGKKLSSYSRKNPEVVDYECLSNDISYDGGLKFKTKARIIIHPLSGWYFIFGQ